MHPVMYYVFAKSYCVISKLVIYSITKSTYPSGTLSLLHTLSFFLLCGNWKSMGDLCVCVRKGCWGGGELRNSCSKIPFSKLSFSSLLHRQQVIWDFSPSSGSKQSIDFIHILQGARNIEPTYMYFRAFL